jgi:hypothetical protein
MIGAPTEKIAPPLEKMPKAPPKTTPPPETPKKNGSPEVRIETQPIAIPQGTTPPAIIPPVPAAPSVEIPVPAPRVDGDRREPF